jgi:hypothetical protein
MKTLHEFLNWLFGKPCTKCGSRSLQRGHYTSGWNNLCNQASGDNGVICRNCLHIEFDLPFEERERIRAKSSPWVILHR